MIRTALAAALLLLVASLGGCGDPAPQGGSGTAVREVNLEQVPLDAGAGAVLVVERVVLSTSELEVHLTYRNSGDSPVRLALDPDVLKANVEGYRWDFTGSLPAIDADYVLAAGEQRAFLLRYNGYLAAVDPFRVQGLELWLPRARKARLVEALPGYHLPVRPVAVTIALGE